MHRRLRRFLLMEAHTCPWWLAYSWDNPLRRLIHNPARIFGDLVEEGQTAVDIGCGLGYFSLTLADMVGARGKVIAVDIQPEMLERAQARARRRGVEDSIDFRLAERDRVGLTEPVDFVLAFWVVHEVLSQEALLTELRTVLKPSGHLLLVEPRVHVPAFRFEKTVEIARRAGFDVAEGPAVRLSRSVVCSPSPS